jgi:hypothetical protein
MTDLQVQQATPHSTLEQAPALNPAKVAQLVNNFVLSTSRFLNSFVQNADVKLAKVSSKISNVETMMAILEVRLPLVCVLFALITSLPIITPLLSPLTTLG